MAFKTNKHVERMHRYLPLSPDHDQIYEEYQKSSDSLNLPTKALDYLLKAAESESTIVVLTGDAGHGKTHLCRRLLQKHLGFSEQQARDAINQRCDGSSLITAVNGREARPLRLFKDFSEPPVDVAAGYIEESVGRENELLVICVNEGRFRAVLESESASEICARLSQDFRDSFDNGFASRCGKIHIINLNYQSVAGDSERSLVGEALHQWLSGIRWKACASCDARDSCSIHRNREMLALDKLHSKRRERLKKIYRTAERLGAVITIRDMLMSVAYLLTGGLRCTDVHEKVKSEKQGWQNEFAFYNVLFSKPEGVSSESLARIPTLQHLLHLDPGLRAPRSIDDILVNSANVFEEGDVDLGFLLRKGGNLVDAANGIDDIIGNPRNRKERNQEAQFVNRVVRSLRRRAFFDCEVDETKELPRLGFEYGNAFEDIVLDRVSPPQMAKLKNLIIAGLHAIQGLQMSPTEANLQLVDPAFGHATAHAAIIARRISSRNVRLSSQQRAWPDYSSPPSKSLVEAVDWIDRRIVLQIGSAEESDSMALDLLMFDFIARAGSGYVAEDFYSHDIRKVLNFLGRLAERESTSSDEIKLFLNRQLCSVSIDGGVIQVGS